MSPLDLPVELTTPVVISGRVAAKVMLDLTLYLPGPSVEELEYLIDLYERLCPPENMVSYKIAEQEYWPELANPVLTSSGRTAAAAAIERPYLQPVRQRIGDGRAFEIQFWDGRSIDNSDGSWSFSCRRIHLRSTGLHAFVRILIPLQANPNVLETAALAIADNVELYSGHGGLVFVYDPLAIASAFDSIYALARRFWGVDVEYLNETLPLMREGIKGVNWITALGPKLASDDSAAVIAAALAQLANEPEVTIEPRRHGTVLIAGPQSAAGDQHRPDHSLDSYYAVASALAPLFLDAHPDFPSEQFITNGNTVGWIRRFIDPDGWR